MEEVEDAISGIEGWMVKNGPLSAVAELGMKEIIFDLEEAMESYAIQKSNMESKVEEAEEQLKEQLEKSEDVLLAKLADVRGKNRVLRKEAKEMNESLETASRRIEYLEIDLKAERERRCSDVLKLKQRIRELEQNALSEAW